MSQLCVRQGCSSETANIFEAKNPNFTVSYDPPVITSVVPNHGPTAGGYPIALYGQSFGLSGATVNLFTISSDKPDVINLPVLSQNHSALVVLMRPATGIFLNMSVTVGGQTHLLENAWNFDAPVILEVRPASNRDLSSLLPCDNSTAGIAAAVAGKPCTSNWLAAPGGDIEIYGYNFGPNPAAAALTPISVYVGGMECKPSAGSLYQSDSKYVVWVCLIVTLEQSPSRSALVAHSNCFNFPLPVVSYSG